MSEHLEARFCFLDDMFKIYTKIQKSQCDIVSEVHFLDGKVTGGGGEAQRLRRNLKIRKFPTMLLCFLKSWSIFEEIIFFQHPIRDYRDLPSPTPCAFHKNKLDKLCTLTLAVSELWVIISTIFNLKSKNK